MVNLLTTNELAERLNLHRITVRRMSIDGRIPSIFISDTETRYDWDDVIAALKNNSKSKAAK